MKSPVQAAAAPHANVVSALVLLAVMAPGLIVTLVSGSLVGAIVGAVAGLLLMQSPKVAKQWEKSVVLRLGRFVGVQEPGLFWIVRLIDSVPAWSDQREIT